MSKYRTVNVEFKSESALVQALEDACAQLGIHYEHHPDGAPLYGYLGDLRNESAHYIIRKQHVGPGANDLGFARQADGSFAAIISDFDAGTGMYAGDHENARYAYIKQRYAYHQICNVAFEQGYTVYEESLPDGTIQLALERAW